MTLARRIESNQHQRQSACREVIHKTSTHTEAPTPSRPSFASRMVQLVFRRESDSTAAETRPKSWSGHVAPPADVATPASATLARHASASILIPSRLSSSATSTSRRSRPQHVRVRDSVAATTGDDATSSNASWRQRQTHCVNCERLFFTLMSAYSNSAGRFCSLDCKTSFEYMNQLQRTLDGLAFSASNLGSSSIGSWNSRTDQGEVEAYDSCCSGGTQL